MYKPLALLLGLALVPRAASLAQTPDSAICDTVAQFGDEAAKICKGFARVNDARSSSLVDLEHIRELAESPETLNRVLLSHLDKRHGWQFLKDINFEFKAFDATESDNTALGFSYDYDNSFVDHDLRCSREGCIRGLDLSFSATGNIAFDSDVNPRDFLETKLSFAFFQSKGGVQAGDETLREELDETVERFFAAESDTEADVIGEDVVRMVRQALTPQLYFHIAGELALESDQRFDATQTVWAVRGAVDFKDWTNQTAWTKFNIFDYPAALIRVASGHDGCGSDSGTCFAPRGTALPTLVIGAGRVSPTGDDPRAQLGDSSDFTRLDAEISYRSPVARIADDNLYLSVNWRYFEELDPTQAVRDAKLDRFSLLTLAVGGSEGVYISYSDGKLPFAFADDQVLELGFKFRL